MSEGINFANGLARCVVMVGLPFAPPESAELRERMQWLDSRTNLLELYRSSADVATSESPGQQYYVNLCMRKVNQSIGRAIRHIGDYASIVLVDERYRSKRIKSKVPEWIQKSMSEPKAFGEVMGTLRRFFRSQKEVTALEKKAAA